MLHRILTLIIKELRVIMRSRESRTLVIMPVLMQVAVFPFAATLEITNARLGIYNDDMGLVSSEITQRLSMGGSFSHVLLLHNDAELNTALNNQQVLLAVRFPANFSRSVLSGRSAPVQVLLDGRRSNAAQVALNYVQSIISQYQSELAAASVASAEASVVRTQLEFRNWYNPNLDYKWFVLPSLVALITTIGVMIFTSLSVAREREQGTMEQLLVSPLSTGQIFVGKAVPAIIVAIFQASIVLLAGIFAYGIPFAGSIPLFYLNILLYSLSLVGVGLLISALCNTQQQALIGVFLFLMPSILLSGYLTPVENMPHWLQYATFGNPIRHFTEITKQIYLKDADFQVLWQSMYPLLLIIFFTVSCAYAFFRRKIG